MTGVGARSGGVGAEVGGQERPQRESQQEAETDGRGRQELKESESTQGSWLQPVGANENRRKTCLGATESKRGVGGLACVSILVDRGEKLRAPAQRAGDVLPRRRYGVRAQGARSRTGAAGKRKTTGPFTL